MAVPLLFHANGVVQQPWMRATTRRTTQLNNIDHGGCCFIRFFIRGFPLLSDEPGSEAGSRVCNYLHHLVPCACFSWSTPAGQ